MEQWKFPILSLILHSFCSTPTLTLYPLRTARYLIWGCHFSLAVLHILNKFGWSLVSADQNLLCKNSCAVKIKIKLFLCSCLVGEMRCWATSNGTTAHQPNMSKSLLVIHKSLGTKLQQHLLPETTHSPKVGSLLGQLRGAMDRAVYVRWHLSPHSAYTWLTSNRNTASYSQTSVTQRYHPAL